MNARRLVMGLLAGLTCFGLGLGAARLLGPPPAPPPPPAEPRIMIDTGSLQLLPDASLHLDLPADFDASPSP
jgi:hypothetical protein